MPSIDYTVPVVGMGPRRLVIWVVIRSNHSSPLFSKSPVFSSARRATARVLITGNGALSPNTRSVQSRYLCGDNTQKTPVDSGLQSQWLQATYL